MPVALSTTKRKLHKILDSISNASSLSLASGKEKYNASTTTLPTITDSPAKKPRIERPVSAYVPPSTRITAKATSKARPLSAVQAPPSATMIDERKPPNFAPWDRSHFLTRLKTYRHVDKWKGKPEKINEVQWSKRGWSCVGKERVGCVGGCGKEVVILLETGREDKGDSEARTPDQLEDDEDEDDWRERAQAQLVEKYAELIISAHEGGCLWRRRGCDDSIQRLPLAHQGTAIQNLRQRYTSLAAMSSELPPNPSTPDTFDYSSVHEQLQDLLLPPSEPEAQPPKDPETPSTLNSPAMLLALFGWQAEEDHIAGLATCTACFRRLGLWLFKPSSDSSIPSSMERLDVVGEHRDYCPWINPLSQNGAASRRTSLDGLAGWQVVVRAVQVNVLHKKYDSEKTLAEEPKDTLEDTASGIGSLASSATMKEDRIDQDVKDKERFAKLKRLKQVFNVKRGKGKDSKTSVSNI